MDKATQHLVEAAKALTDGLDGLVDKDRWRTSPDAMRNLRVHTLRVAIEYVAEGERSPAPVLPGDYGVKFVGVSAAGQAILKIVGGPEDKRQLFTPLRLLFPPLFKVSVDHTYWKGVVSNRVRMAKRAKSAPSPLRSWQAAVATGATHMGYTDWVVAQGGDLEDLR